MIYLRTGAPGAGKTLGAVEFIETILAEDSSRVVYSNIKGINYPGVVVVDNEWMDKWWDQATPGSFIVIDEAQKVWRATRGGGDPGRAITDLEEHRHDGIDIVMITQHPTLIHANIRKLVTNHVHVVEYTKESALRWEWRECHDDVQDKQLRQSGEFKEWKYPKHLYEYYTSAFQHTKRTKRPKAQVRARIFAGIALTLVVGLVGALAWHAPDMWRKAQSMGSAKKAAPHDRDKAVSDDGASLSKPVRLSTVEYLAQQMPRVQEQPWSAPIYDGQSVTSHPQVWCIAPEKPDRCACITEQGTHYAMEDDRCRVYAAEGGTYDPYKPTRKDDDSRPSQARSAPTEVAQVGEAAMPAGIPAPARGGGGVGSQEYVPPTFGNWDANYFGGGKSGR